jgi:hypothetical protein
MTLDERIEKTSVFLRTHLVSYQNPCAFISFGKDSLVLLWLLRALGSVPPIIFYADPWFPAKYAFARRIIEQENLTVFDYPPLRVSMLYGKGLPAFTNEYQTSAVTTLAVPKNIVEYEDGQDESKYLCGVSFFTRPTGTFAFPWDAALVGHKDCDTDQIYGPVPLHCDVLYCDSGPDYLYPLKEWTDPDIWDFIERYSVPIQTDRYDVKNRREWGRKTFNSDYWEACIRCVDKRRAGETVYCPKFKIPIENMSGQVNEFTHKFEYFGE